MESLLENYNSSEINLTQKEMTFMMMFLSNNGCGAQTPGELLEDNFSCQTFEDLVDMFPNWSKPTIKGILGSLVNKNVIMIEDDRNMDPDLYWATDHYLKQLNPELKFF